MKSEDFKYEYIEEYLEDVYVYDNKDYILIIDESIFDREATNYNGF